MAKLRSLPVFCLLLLSLGLHGQGSSGSLDLGLEEGGLDTRLILGGGQTRLILDFQTQCLGQSLTAGLEAPGFLLGPATFGSLAAFLHNPGSEAESTPTAPFLDLDPSLSSSLEVLSLELLDRQGGGDEGTVVLARALQLAVLAREGGLSGLALGLLSRFGGQDGWPRLSLACVVTDQGLREVPAAWKPGPGPGPGQAGILGFSVSSKGPGLAALFEAALSLGPLLVGGRAFRLEARLWRNGLDLGLRAGLASRDFSSLLPSTEGPTLALGLDGRLALGRGARLMLALRASSPSLEDYPGPGLLDCPDRKASLSLQLPTGVESLVLVTPRLDLGSAAGQPFLEARLGLAGKAPSLDWGLTARSRDDARQWSLSLTAEAPPGRGLVLGRELILRPAMSLGLGQTEDQAYPRLELELELGLEEGLGMGESMRLSASLESMGLSLLAPGAAGPPWRLGLVWKRALPGPPRPPGPPVPSEP